MGWQVWQQSTGLAEKEVAEEEKAVEEAKKGILWWGRWWCSGGGGMVGSGRLNPCGGRCSTGMYGMVAWHGHAWNSGGR